MDATKVARTFFDTNILVYAFDFSDSVKQKRAAVLLTELAGSIVISSQVLSEFYWTVTRKLSSPLGVEEAREAVNHLCDFIVVPIDRELVRAAIELCDSALIAYWDALIIRAASSQSCERVLTEDLNHDQVIDGVRVENPFLGLP